MYKGDTPDSRLYKLHDDPVDISDGDLEDEIQLLDETNYIVRDAIDLPTERTPWDGLLASKSLLSLREEWFTGNEFSAGILVSDIKYKHPGLKHQNSFYPFNDQLDYALTHYFAKLETTKGNVNKFLFDPLMTSLIKKLSYKNADEEMEKLSKIPWGISEDKWIEHKYNVESGVSEIAGQEIAIQLRNVLSCIKFLMGHPGFQHNQTYRPFCVYNQNEDRVYNEMHTRDWWWKQQMENPPKTTIIPILLSSNKTVISLSHGDQTLWPVYITIGNLDSKTWRSQTRLGTLLLGSIPIVPKRLEDENNKDQDLKANIYHLVLTTMLQCKCSF